MKAIAQFVRSFMRDEDGVTSIEYGLIAAVIALVIIGAASDVGTALQEKFVEMTGMIPGA
ncbi:MAG TPA: Flp family type IVb pilin [Telluria sp.]|nr:Flp family type IVb pilin [Telluria sp.]